MVFVSRHDFEKDFTNGEKTTKHFWTLAWMDSVRAVAALVPTRSSLQQERSSRSANYGKQIARSSAARTLSLQKHDRNTKKRGHCAKRTRLCEAVAQADLRAGACIVCYLSKSEGLDTFPGPGALDDHKTVDLTLFFCKQSSWIADSSCNTLTQGNSC